MYSKRGGNILHNESAMSESKHMVERIYMEWPPEKSAVSRETYIVVILFSFVSTLLFYKTTLL